jgi:hypothetical protein
VRWDQCFLILGKNPGNYFSDLDSLPAYPPS